MPSVPVSEMLRGARWQLLGPPDVPEHVRRVSGRVEPHISGSAFADRERGRPFGSPVTAACCQRPARGGSQGSQPAAPGQARFPHGAGPLLRPVPELSALRALGGGGDQSLGRGARRFSGRSSWRRPVPAGPAAAAIPPRHREPGP